MKRFSVGHVAGRRVAVVDPIHFYAAQSGGGRGLGLYCNVDLELGDCWWVHNLTDPRYVSQVIPWAEYMGLPTAEKQVAETLCYVDFGRRALVVCAEPFCRTNHARLGVANSACDAQGNSVVVSPIPAGVEVTHPYDYEAVVSLVWKFPTFRDRLTAREIADDAFLLQPVTTNAAALAFLDEL